MTYELIQNAGLLVALGLVVWLWVRLGRVEARMEKTEEWIDAWCPSPFHPWTAMPRDPSPRKKEAPDEGIVETGDTRDLRLEAPDGQA